MEKSLKVLVVDDDRDSITTLSDQLLAYKHTIVAASSGVEALSIADKEKPDLALINIRLPELDGYELCRRIKQMRSPSKVILFTPYGDAVHVAKAKKVGADDFIAKTADFANMHRAIEKLVAVN